jgi:hypothetical protein
MFVPYVDIGRHIDHRCFKLLFVIICALYILSKYAHPAIPERKIMYIPLGELTLLK